MRKLIIMPIISALCVSCQAQDWFSVVYSQLNVIERPINSIEIKSIENNHQITIDQYNELIGNKIGHNIYDGELRENIVYGYFDINNVMEGLNPPTFSIIGKEIYNIQNKSIILRIDEDPRIDMPPTLQICLFDDDNNYLSGIMISGGESESYSCKILEDRIEQFIFTEDSKITNTFIINSQGYFELVNTIEVELEY